MNEQKNGRKEERGTRSGWPSIKLKFNLQVNRLKDNDLITVQNFFTPAESQAFVKAAESLGFAHQGSLGPAYGEAYRDNDRVSMNDPDLAGAIWRSGLNKLFSDIKIRGKVAVGLNRNIRFYRLGIRLARDFDGILMKVLTLEKGSALYTLLIYLSGGPKSKTKVDKDSQDSLSETLVGGETVFYGLRNALVAEVPPTEGMALVHIHGDKCMLHEVRNVTKVSNMYYVLMLYLLEQMRNLDESSTFSKPPLEFNEWKTLTSCNLPSSIRNFITTAVFCLNLVASGITL